MKSRLTCFWRGVGLLGLLIGFRHVTEAQWVEQGPGPDTVPGDFGYTQVSGHIQAIAADPANSDRVFVGAPNGGVWRTLNANASSPSWTPLTDQQPSLSVSCLAFDPLDTQHNTLYAGINYASSGYPHHGSGAGPLAGILKTVDGGDQWTVFSQSTFTNRGVQKILPTPLTTSAGQIIFVLASGLWRSTNGGASWGFQTVASGSIMDIVEDPGNPARLFIASVNPLKVYRSEDSGSSWTNLSSAAGFPASSGSATYLALSPSAASGSHWVYLMDSGRMFFSSDLGSSWTAMDVLPGGANLNGELVGSPANANIIFGVSPGGLNGLHWRGNANASAGNQWFNISPTNSGGTDVHTDAHDWVFSADPNVMFEANDGGIYRLRNPLSNSPSWESANGNLRVTEFLSVAYDTVNHIIFGACWDNSIPQQTVRGSIAWGANESFHDDGMQVGVDNTSIPGASVHYSSQQGLFYATRRTNTTPSSASETLLKMLIYVGPSYTPTSCDGSCDVSSGESGYRCYNCVEGALTRDGSLGTVRYWRQDWSVNAVDGRRLLLGTDYLYESFDRGDHFTSLGGIVSNPDGDAMPTNAVGEVTAYAYGHPQNADIFYVGTTGAHSVGSLGTIPRHLLWFRSSGTGYPSAIDAYQNAGGSTPFGIVMDPNDWNRTYVVDSQGRVWRTTDAGATVGNWTQLTGNLNTFTKDLRTIDLFSPTVFASEQALLVGGLGGVYVSRSPSTAGAGAIWERLGGNFPNAIVSDLHYYKQDDLLLAGTYGRGAWTVPNVSSVIFPDDCFITAPVLSVPNPYTTVHAAYNTAGPGCSIIRINAGTFHEAPMPFTLNKHVRLESQGGAAIIRGQ